MCTSLLLLLALPFTPLQGEDYPERTFHSAPKTHPEGAVVEDWPDFLGPRRDGRSRESGLDFEFGEEGPPLVWEMSRGEGYAAPSLASGRLVYTHSVGRKVHVDCLDPETGLRYWRDSRDFEYEPRYIRNSGPRAAPVLDGDSVFVASIDNVLTCYGLADGKVRWRRDLREELEAPDDFFGVVSTPLVVGELLIQNVGVPGGPSVMAFDKKSGATRWGAEEEWGPSCGSPVLADVGGVPRLLVMAGGDSRPPVGGLLVMEPEDGTILYRYPFRSRVYESVLAASPLALGDQVLVTSGYNTGTAVVAPGEEGQWGEVWKTRSLGCEFTQPIAEGGLVHLVDGISGRAGAVVCLDPSDGEVLARTEIDWEETVELDGAERTRSVSIGQGSLLHVDGGFLLLGDRGHLLRVESTREGARVLARARLFFASETWSRPVLHRGLLYVCQNNRDMESGAAPRLLCYDLRAGS